MSKEQKFYICQHCGNIATLIENKGVPLVCCGEKMKELIANTSDGAKEKHVPVVLVDGNKVNVSVGSVPHPMLPEHHISWIYLQTNLGGQIKYLDVDKVAVADYLLTEGEIILATFEYCNLHGLWKYEL